MKRLIKSELYKLFKSKFHIILIILLTISTIVLTYMSHKEYGKLYDDFKYYENFAGEKINSISAAKIVDETLHQYKGEWSDETYQKMEEDYLDLISKYPRLVIDEEVMIKAYGKDYQTIMNKSLAGNLTESDIQDYMAKSDTFRGSYSANEDGYYHIELYYNEDGVHNLISLIYSSPYMMGDNEPSEEFYYTWNFYDQIYKDGKSIIEGVNDYRSMSSSDLLIQDYLMSKAENLPQTFDSAISNNLLINSLQRILLVPLFVVVILLANIFGIEKQNGMEEIIYPSVSAKYKITIAKVITGTCVGVSIVWLQILVCFIVSYILLPVHTWNMTITTMANSSLTGYNSIYIPFTYLTVILYSFILITIGTFLTSLITLLVSYVKKSRFVVVIVMSVLIVLSWFIKDIAGIPTLIKGLMPFNMLSFLDYFYGYVSYSTYPYLVLGNIVIPLRILVIVISILFIFIALRMLVKHSRKPSIYD